MKAIDHCLGIPVCLLLEVYQRVTALFGASKKRPVRRILFMKFFGMGSILLATPMLRAVKNRYPEAELFFLTFASNREFVERLGVAETILTLRTDSPCAFCRDLFHVLRLLKRRRFDVTVDMEFFSKFSTIISYLSGSPVRIGYFLHQLWRGELLTDKIPYNHYKHITEVFADLAGPLGVTVKDCLVVPPSISAEEKAQADRLLAVKGVSSGEMIIGFNVNVSELSLERRWPREQFITLAQSLLTELDARLVFVGSPQESEYVSAIFAELPGDGRAVNIAGQTSLGELIGVLDRCRVFITNDSGPLHIAAALGVATVSFFGPETPVLYGPKGGDALVFYEGTHCSPCLNVFNVKTAPCAGSNICMQSVEAGEVLSVMRSHYADIWKEHALVG